MSFVVKALIAAALVIGLIISILAVLIRRKYTKQPADLKIGKPFGLPLIGHAFELLPEVMLGTLVKYSKAYGKIFELFAFNQRMWVITDPNLIREMAVKRPKIFRRIVNMDYSGVVLGYKQGLAFSHGPIWNRLRKLSAIPLAKHHIAHNLEDMCKESMRTVKSIFSRADGKTTVNVNLEMFLYTLHVIVMSTFGFELTGEYAAYFFDAQFCEDVLTVIHFFFESAVFPAPMWLWRLIPHYANIEKQGVEADARYTVLFQKIINEKRRELAEHPERSTKHAVIDVMISKETSDVAGGAEVSDAEVLATVKTFMIAGSETTAITLSWSLYLLSLNREVLEEARAEVAPFFAVRDSLDADQLWSALSPEKMPLCHAIIKESLRMYSPITTNFFQLEQEYNEFTLSNGLVLLKEDIVLPFADAIHTNEETFPDPHSFRPRRWLTTDTEQLAKMEAALIAFGGGTRVCPGQGLAHVEGVVGLSAFIHHLDFTLACPASEVKRIISFSAQPSQMPMTFTKRAGIAV